jgi:predicted peroxiredoxin
MPQMNVMQPAMKQPTVAMFSVLEAMQRAWKSSAARLPKPRMKMVAQFHMMALGKGVRP